MTSTPAYTLHLPLVMKNWPWLYETECETSAAYTVGQRLSRANACQTMVHGQFGATPGWTKQPGYVRYDNISSFEFDHLYLQVRFSKNTAANVPIDVYIDNEVIPRASFYPKNQYSWNRFDCEINVVGSTSGWVYSVDLGHISSGAHFIKFYTAGQDYAVADLDKFILSNLPLTEADCHRCPFIAPTEQK
ncbi:MAG: hypothetical protein JW953_05535 [Anaerolineae bacterium]|nr:hypothetical protein [Anaerolineae bacterium]